MEEKLLVHQYFPIDEVSEESVVEKNGRPPIFEMHYWWTRKPLVVSRASILMTSLLENTKIEQLKAMQGFERPIKYRKNRSFKKKIGVFLPYLQEGYNDLFGTRTPTLLDPFAGGGSIPFEALRLGFNVIASDYNPVAWLILKATLEYPKKYGDLLIDRVREAYNNLVNSLEEDLYSLYTTKKEEKILYAYVYCWIVSCPFCGFEAPLVNNWILKKKKIKGSTEFEWIYIVPKSDDGVLDIEICKEIKEKPTKLIEGTNIRGKGICLNCQNTIENKHIVKEISSHSKEKMLAVVYVSRTKFGKIYELPSDNDLELYEKCLDNKPDIDLSLSPMFSMPEKVIMSTKYLRKWDQLFNKRQRYFFSTFVKKCKEISKIYDQKYGSEWGKIIAVYFSILIGGKLIHRNSRITGWDYSNEKSIHALSFRTLSLVWDHIEINPFAPEGSGTLNVMIKNVIDGVKFAVEYLQNTPGSVEVNYSSAISLKSQSVDLIVTDPPYGDDVPYSEVSEFMYSWQQLILQEYFPFLPQGSVPSSEDLSDNRANRGMDFVQLGLQSSFKNLHSLLNDSGYFTLFFAHSSLDTWSFVINALMKAGFQIFATYPVHTENPNNPITRGKASFFTSILIFCRKREGKKSAYLEDLEEELQESIRSRVRSFLDSGLRGADLSMAALGPALEILTSYSDLKTISGSLDIADVLALTNKPVIEETLGKFIEDSASLDGPTQLYLFARVNGMTKIPFDTLQILSKSLNIDLSLSSDLLVEYQSGKHKLFSFNSYNSRDIQLSQFSPLIDYLHFAFQQFEQKGESAFWSVFVDSSYSRQNIVNLLSAIVSGIFVPNGRVASELDSDAQIASQLLSLSPNYKPIRRMGEKQRITTLDEFTKKDEAKNE